MFVLCPHCQFLVALDAASGRPPARCKRCGGALLPEPDVAPAPVAAAPETVAPGETGASTEVVTDIGSPADVAASTNAGVDVDARIETAIEASGPIPAQAVPAAATNDAAHAASSPLATGIEAEGEGDGKRGRRASTATPAAAAAPDADAPAASDPDAMQVAVEPAPAAAGATDGDPNDEVAATAAPRTKAASAPEATPRPGAVLVGHPLPIAPAPATPPVPSFAPIASATSITGTRRRRWRKPAAIAALSLLLGLQLLLAQRNALAADPAWRPWITGLCNVARCTLPPWREPAAFVLLHRDVRAHPRVAGALHVTATFRNDARWPQPWPALLLTLSDLDGRGVGARVFTAREYLGGAPTQTTLASGQSATVAFDVLEPTPRIVAFTFDFR